MKVLSCFDGMSCGQIALERAGIPIEKYYASEIDKYAIQVTMSNYPNTIQLGSITEWQSWNIDKPDIIIGGSPCQGFSFAGKQLNFEDERSKLFFEFYNILKHYKPKYFLLENVIMKQDSNDVISSMLGELYPECVHQGELFRIGRLEPIEINSSLVSAQNRRRLYWTNIPGIEQPEDRGILLKDVIESGETEKEKSQTILSTLYKENCKSMIQRNKTGLCVTSGAFRDETGKSNALTSVSKDSLCIEIGKADINCHESRKRVYSIDGKAPTIPTCQGGNQEPKILQDNITWRKLTPIECERLQTVPDNYTNHVSNSQRYKMLGNGWTVDVIAHILKYIEK